jgi:hypothetical protein
MNPFTTPFLSHPSSTGSSGQRRWASPAIAATRSRCLALGRQAPYFEAELSPRKRRRGSKRPTAYGGWLSSELSPTPPLVRKPSTSSSSSLAAMSRPCGEVRACGSEATGGERELKCHVFFFSFFLKLFFAKLFLHFFKTFSEIFFKTF